MRSRDDTRLRDAPVTPIALPSLRPRKQVCQSRGSGCEAARYDPSSRGLLSFFVSGADTIVHSGGELDREGISRRLLGRCYRGAACGIAW